MLAFDGGDRLLARFRFGHDDDVVERAEERGEKRARRTLVVGDHDAEAGVHDAFDADARSGVRRDWAGMMIRTVVPRPG